MPEFSKATFIGCVVCGALCLLWGYLGRRSAKCRLPAILTLAAAACMLLFQAKECWLRTGQGDSDSLTVAALMTVLFVFSAGMILNLIQQDTPCDHAG